MKKIIVLLMGSLLLAFLAACGSSDDVSEKDGTETYVLKVATPAPEEGGDSVFSYKPWMEKVTELTDGRVEFDWYPSETLGKTGDNISMVKDGVADVAYYNPSYYESTMPIAATFIGLPGLFNSSFEGTVGLWEASNSEPMLETDFLRNGVRPVLTVGFGAYNLYTKGTEIKVPEDLDGVKVRSAGGVHSDMLEFIGGIPIQVAGADVQEAYDKGVFQALHLIASSDTLYGVQELSKYGTRGLGFGGTAYGLVINEELYQSFPEDIQEAIQEAGKEISYQGAKDFDEDIIDREDRWIADGSVPLYEPSEAEMEEWNTFYEEFEADWIEKQTDEDILESLNIFKEAIENYKE